MVSTAAEALLQMETVSNDVVLASALLPAASRGELTSLVGQQHPDCSLLLIGSDPEPDASREPTSAPPFERLSTPVRSDELLRCVSAALRIAYLERQVRDVRRQSRAFQGVLDEMPRELRPPQNNAHQALEDAPAHLTSIATNIPGVLCQLALGPASDVLVPYLGDSAQRFLQLDPERVMHRPSEMLDRIAPSDRQRLADDLLRAIETQRPLSWEGRYTPPAGEEQWLQYTGHPGKTNGPNTADGIFVNITERKRLQARLMRSDRMATMGMLATGLGHEINNPLTSGIANLELLGDALTAEGLARRHPEFVELLSEAAEGALRVNEIAQDLKAFGGRGDDETQLIDLPRVLDSAARIAQNEVRHRAVLTRSYDETPRVLGSSPALGQVFLNLIMNAAQSFPDDHASEHRIEISTGTHPDGRALVEIRDTGRGIPEELLSGLFDPFVSGRHDGRGTGIGLYICRETVTAMGGVLTLATGATGTTCTILLPDAPPQSDVHPAPVSARPPKSNTARVLVIDDEALIGRIIRRGLVEHAVRVELNTRSAEAALAEESFDVILCDVMMPDGSGPDLYQHIARLHPGEEKKLIFMTGGAFTSEARSFLAGVKNPILEKPFTLPDVRAAVSDLAARSAS